MVTGCGIQKERLFRCRDVMFHVAQNIEYFEKVTQPEGVTAPNLGVVPSPPQSGTNGEDVHNDGLHEVGADKNDDGLEGAKQGEHSPHLEIEELQLRRSQKSIRHQ